MLATAVEVGELGDNSSVTIPLRVEGAATVLCAAVGATPFEGCLNVTGESDSDWMYELLTTSLGARASRDVVRWVLLALTKLWLGEATPFEIVAASEPAYEERSTEAN